MPPNVLTGLSLDKLISLLEDLPLEQKITLKSNLEVMIANGGNRASPISDEEISFISNLFVDT